MANFFETVGIYLNGFFDEIIEILAEIGEALLRIFVWVFNFTLQIFDFFQRYANKYGQDPNVVGFNYLIDREMQAGNANVIKGILRNPSASGAIVKGFYNTKTKKIYAEDMEVDEFSKMDDETAEKFDGKNLLIIE
jgi:hypothetical protein